MDCLIGGLEATKARRRTTYKKVPREEDEQLGPSIPPTVLGDGFLFESNILNKVKNRLNNEGYEKEHLHESSTLFGLYGNGEELEKEIATRHEGQKKSMLQTNATNQETQLSTLNESLSIVSNNLNKYTSNKKNDRSAKKCTESTTEEPTQVITTCSIDVSRTQVILPMDKSDTHPEGMCTVSHSTPSQSLGALTLPDHVSVRDNDLQATSADSNQITRLKIHEIQQEVNRESRQNCTELKLQKVLPKPKVTFSRETFMEDFDESSDSDCGDSHRPPESVQNNLNPCEPDISHIAVQKSGSLNAYRRELKEQIEIDNLVPLSSESDDSDGGEASTSFASKATVLEIRARLSKRKVSSKISHGGASLAALMSNLKKASKKQILECQKEMIERHGLKLEDIEKEKEMVENLLEQEIARNKRIRRREREKKNQGNRAPQIEQADLDDIQESDSDGYSLSGSSSDESAVVSDSNEPPLCDQQTLVANDITINESDDDNVLKGKNGPHKAPILSENENETDENEDLIKDGIDLGSYGSNILVERLDNESDSGEGQETQSIIENETEQYADLMKEERKRKALEERQKMDEMKKSGVTNMFDMEAEESDDEWKGLGGAEGETIDDYDSDLERMIDDLSNTTSNADQIRQLLIAENRDTDLKTVNRILYDLKHGGFRKRRNNEFHLDLSDEEDDELRKYRKKRMESMKKKRLQLGATNQKLLKNSKSHAFFESMLEDLMDVKKPFDDQPVVPTEEQEPKSESVKDSAKKIVSISQEFVQESLSFLCNSRGNEEFETSQMSKDGPAAIDLSTLKRQSSVKALHAPHAIKIRKQDHSLPLPAEGTYVSIVKTVGNNSDPDDKLKDGRKTVTVSKSYKTVGGSKASVTYLAKMRKLVAPKSKRKPLISQESELPSIGKNKIFGSFDSSFETET